MFCTKCGTVMGMRLMPEGNEGWRNEYFCPKCKTTKKAEHVSIIDIPHPKETEFVSKSAV